MSDAPLHDLFFTTIHLGRATTASMRLFTLCLLAACAQALHSYEAGVTDWHKPFAGVPLLLSESTSPVFHRSKHEDGQSSSVVLSATQSNVLAAYHSVNGSLGELQSLMSSGLRN